MPNLTPCLWRTDRCQPGTWNRETCSLFLPVLKIWTEKTFIWTMNTNIISGLNLYMNMKCILPEYEQENWTDLYMSRRLTLRLKKPLQPLQASIPELFEWDVLSFCPDLCLLFVSAKKSVLNCLENFSKMTRHWID